MEFNSIMKVVRVVAPLPAALIDYVTDADEPPAAPPPPPPPPPPVSLLPGATATPAEARGKANALWNKGNEGKDIVTRSKLAALEEKAANWEKAGANNKKHPEYLKQAAEFRAQASAMRKELDDADMEAVKQLSANRKLEQDKLKTLSPAARAQYQKLEQALEHDPQGHLALQVMLIEGKLEAEPKNKDGKNLLDALGRLSDAKLAAPLKSADVLGEACREIANPASIKQKGLNTCSAAALQIMVATERPAEYVRILTGLASETGSPVALAQNGKSVQRNDSALYPDDSGRTATSQLWQASFMQYAATTLDPNANYDNGTDTITWGDGHTSKDGMFGEGTHNATLAVMGGERTFVSQGNSMDAIIGVAINDLKAKPPVRAKLELGAAYDASGNPTQTQVVTLQKFTPAKVNAQGKVITPATYTVKDDKTGKLLQLSGKELGERLQAVPSKGWDREKQTDFMMKQLQDDVNKGRSAIVMLRWGEFQGATPKLGGAKGEEFNHFVTVTKIDGDQVYFKNSQGKDERMPLAEFKNKLANLTAEGPVVAP